MKTKWTGAVALTAMTVGGLLLSPSILVGAKEDDKAKTGSAAPAFKLKDTFGKEFSLADFKGKVVVLEWFNRKCPASKGCHNSATMQDTYKKYADKGVIWLAIDTTAGSDPEANRVYAADQGLAYPILHDTDGKVGKAYGAKTTPHMFIIDKEGILVYTGAIDNKGESPNYVGDALAEVLAGEKVTKSRTQPYGCGVKYPPNAS